MVNMFSSIIAYKIKGRLNSESSWTKSSNDQRTIWNSSTQLNPPAVWGFEEIYEDALPPVRLLQRRTHAAADLLEE